MLNDTPAKPPGLTAFVEHVAALTTTLTLFVDVKPIPVTCTTQRCVIGQSTFWVTGPLSENVPTSRL
jgi:hypothetical protein